MHSSPPRSVSINNWLTNYPLLSLQCTEERNLHSLRRVFPVEIRPSHLLSLSTVAVCRSRIKPRLSTRLDSMRQPLTVIKISLEPFPLQTHSITMQLMNRKLLRITDSKKKRNILSTRVSASLRPSLTVTKHTGA